MFDSAHCSSGAGLFQGGAEALLSCPGACPVLILRRVVADILYARGAFLLEARRARLALLHLALAVRLAPGRAEYVCAAAFAARKVGAQDKAKRYAEAALAIDPGLNVMRKLLSEIALPGEDYLRVLGRIHRDLRPRTYLEIGVSTGASLRLAQAGTVALGVDPQPALAEPLPTHARVFVETSDEFFARRDVRAEFGGLPIELAFIDGMHHFEYALRDFMRIERLSTPESTVLVHDCYPCDEITARRERLFGFWSGDVWRLVILLKKYRPDLQIRTIAAAPSGLCVIRNLDPSSRFIEDNLERLCEEFMALDYAYLGADREAKLNLFPNDWSRIRELLATTTSSWASGTAGGSPPRARRGPGG